MITLVLVSMLITASCISLIAGAIGWRRRATGSAVFLALLLAIAAWSFLSALHLLAHTPAAQLLIAKVQYLPIVSVSPLWLFVTLEVTGRRQLNRHWSVFAMIPVATLALAWTNEYHGWIWSSHHLVGTTLVYTHGPWFWVFAAHSYALQLAAAFLLMQGAISGAKYHRTQRLIVLVAGMFPWLGNLLYLGGIVPFPGFDWTPLGFTLTGLLALWALTRHQLLKLVPIARGMLIEHMQDGVLVLDQRQWIVDHNPAAARLAGVPTIPHGLPVAAALPIWADPIVAGIAQGAPTLIESIEPTDVALEMRATALTDGLDRLIGWLVVLRDITAQRAAEHERRVLEKQLRDEHEFARQVMNTMGEGLTVTDHESRFTFVNPAYARLFGYQPENLLGRTPSEFACDEDKPSLAAARQARHEGKTTTYLSHLRCADGRVTTVQITGAPRIIDGRFVGSVAVITDLSERLAYENELLAARQQLEEANARLSQLALSDSLTGLNNKHMFHQRLREEVLRAARHGEPLALLMIDIDAFKPYNDTYGHVAGDTVLQEVGRILSKQVRSTDVAARYGGEEFGVILPDTDQSGALGLAERLRTAVATASWERRAITISVGAAAMAVGMSDVQLIEIADAALYRSKREGGNRVSWSQE